MQFLFVLMVWGGSDFQAAKGTAIRAKLEHIGKLLTVKDEGAGVKTMARLFKPILTIIEIPADPNAPVIIDFEKAKLATSILRGFGWGGATDVHVQISDLYQKHEKLKAEQERLKAEQEAAKKDRVRIEEYARSRESLKPVGPSCRHAAMPPISRPSH